LNLILDFRTAEGWKKTVSKYYRNNLARRLYLPQEYVCGEF